MAAVDRGHMVDRSHAFHRPVAGIRQAMHDDDATTSGRYHVEGIVPIAGQGTDDAAFFTEASPQSLPARAPRRIGI